jgi:hypothetical protein
MTAKTAKKEELAALPLAVDLSLESLNALFTEFVAGINRQEELEKEEDKALAKSQSVQDAGSLLTVGEKTELAVRRDNLAELLNAIEERELRIRKTVRNAELIARHYAAFTKNLKDSLLLAMIEMGLQEAQGNVHRFAVHKQPDLFIVTDERQIPEKFFDRKPDLPQVAEKILGLIGIIIMGELITDEQGKAMILECLETHIPTEISLNKERVHAAIAAGEEVPGAMVEKNRKRLDVK